MSDDKVLVQNLTNDDITYIDNDGGVERRIIFRGQQSQWLPREMVERMTYDHGGSVLIKHYLSVKDDGIREEIGVPEDQIEYDYTQEDIVEMLQTNYQDKIADALDFGPEGIVEMIVDQAVALPITDTSTMELISNKTNKNIAAMIKNKTDLESATETEKSTAKTGGRRVQTTPSEKKEEGRRIGTTASGKKLVIPE